jgi:hypothetical protein
VFGRVFFVFTQHALLIFDIGLLVLGPLTVLFLHNSKAVQVSWWLDLLMEFKGLSWMTSCWTWAKFWIAVGVGFLLQAVLVTTFLKTNKYVRPIFVSNSSLNLIPPRFRFSTPIHMRFSLHCFPWRTFPPLSPLTSTLNLRPDRGMYS